MTSGLSSTLRRNLSWFAVLTAAALPIAQLNSSAASGQQPNLAAQVQAHLAAGEFGVATNLARQTPANQQNTLLAQIARAQAIGGARPGSLRTAAGIVDDVVRQQTFQNLANQPIHARGGGAQADFDTLIDLIKSTVQPGSWDDAGGPGAIDGFPGGVLVDTTGVMRKVQDAVDGRPLSNLRLAALNADDHQDLLRDSSLRKISLRRLEKELQMLAAQGKPATQAMKNFAGIYSLDYVFIYPKTGDIVLAGPAGRWTTQSEGRVVNHRHGKPVLQLDDFVVMLRATHSKDPVFGCSITPTEESLAKTRRFITESTKKPLQPHQRNGWLTSLRDALGKQDIDVFGINPQTHAARILVEADYRMKLVGMGLEDGTLGVTSYLDSIELKPGEAAPSMNVLRWWFTLNYDAVTTTPNREAFQINGTGVKVLSETELLTAQGKRIHTGKSDELTALFARSFTKNFDNMSDKYPIYAELKNIFDLALVGGLIASDDTPNKIGWTPTFLDPHNRHADFHYEETLAPAPRQVESIINHRVINKTQIIAGVSGGVRADVRSLVRPSAIEQDEYGLLKSQRIESEREMPKDRWWWD
ncbi:MAG: hypothetical protein ACI9HK_003698 [Pirellulaceae bacterium]|jgi:hypothetical protein